MITIAGLPFFTPVELMPNENKISCGRARAWSRLTRV